jgi:hypothetical protein
MSTSELTPELAKEILAAAAARGISVEEYLHNIVSHVYDGEKKVKIQPFSPEVEMRLWVEDREQKSQSLSPQDRVKLWQEWVDSHSYIKAPPLSDYAVSRESIYTREDEAL